jgi:hypothetical protein
MKNFSFSGCEKTKPIKANFKIPQTHQDSGKKKRVSGTFLWLWAAGKIEFFDGFDILFEKGPFDCTQDS